MVSRLVLGCEATGLALVEALTDQRGELFVVEPDESRVEQLRNEKVAAETGDPSDEETLRRLDIEPDVVLVLGDSAQVNRQAAEAVRSVFPDAYVVAYEGEETVRTDRRALESAVDHLLSTGALLVDHLEDVAADGNLSRVHRLRETLWSMDGQLGVFTHDNPDPDAIAAAMALAAVARWFDVDADVCYYGDISHQENRAFVNLLDLELRNLEPGKDPEYDHYALVDHSSPGVNDQLPEGTDIDVVIDHHPPKETVSATFVDVRSEAGATSTLMVDYLRAFEVELQTEVATALLYGIRVDTRDFAQEITTADFEAAAYLLPKADVELLGRVESPSVSPDTLDIIARAIRNRQTRMHVLTSCTGQIQNRDALAQAADRLLNMEDVHVTVVYGFRNGTIYVSARARGVDLDLGEALREAFGDLGSAGGHNNMAGAQISMGLFEAVDDASEAEMTEIVEDVIEKRLYQVIDPPTIEE